MAGVGAEGGRNPSKLPSQHRIHPCTDSISVSPDQTPEETQSRSQDILSHGGAPPPTFCFRRF